MNTEPLVLLPDPAGGPGVALTLPELAEGRRRARELDAGSNSHPPAAANGSDRTQAEGLLDAEALARALSLPASWIETATREGRIPHRKFGRWRRYALTEVLDCPAVRAKRVR